MGPVSAQLMMVWVLCPCNGEGRGVADRVGFQSTDGMGGSAKCGSCRPGGPLGADAGLPR
ncbi:unnamed protein product [Prunus armeniaca]|uniref:Uncharacterized protein n=1 Tax=Prunus armeniaca TaxID=36596 RepID=A0A6J5V7D9_PRUAR|nr:unnamed protein product [Prunus armeniaca]